MLGDLAERGERADPHAGRRRLHVAQRRHRLEADHQLRRVVVDGILERAEQIGAARDHRGPLSVFLQQGLCRLQSVCR